MTFVKKIAEAILKEELEELNSKIENLKKENELLNESVNTLLNSEKITSPKSFGTITWQQELAVLKDFNCPINITDEYLHLTSVEEAQKFVKESKIQYKKWTKEDYDCDNFSASLYGYWSDSLKSFAFGMARSAGHQFNIMIDKDRNVWIVEPQTAKFMTIEEAKKKSSPDGLNYFPITYIWM